MSLQGKVALVTGAGRGIGRGIALRLAQDGADIALVDVTADGIDAVADEVAAIGSKATTFVADVSDRDAVFAAVEHAQSALGGFDIMVNNAGVALVGPVAEVTPDDAARVWGVNVNGVLWGIQPLRPSSSSSACRGGSSTHRRSQVTTGSPCSACTAPASSRCGRSRRPRQRSTPRRESPSTLLPGCGRHGHVGRDRSAVRRPDRRRGGCDVRSVRRRHRPGPRRDARGRRGLRVLPRRTRRGLHDWSGADHRRRTGLSVGRLASGL